MGCWISGRRSIAPTARPITRTSPSSSATLTTIGQVEQRHSGGRVGELGGLQKYLYWSERRVLQWLEGSDIKIPKPSQQKLTTPNFGNFAPAIEISRPSCDVSKTKLAELFSRSLGKRIVSNLDSPAPIEFAQGVGSVLYGQFVSPDGEPLRALMYSRVEVENQDQVAVCLFGSMENLADFIADSEPVKKGWTASSAGDIELFLKTGEVDDGMYLDSVEDLAREAVKIACRQGETRPDRTDGYYRGFTYGETRDVAEWCAEIYWDVDLSETPCGPEEGHSRVLIGAPLWVRTPSLRSVYLYSEYTKREWQNISQDAQQVVRESFWKRLQGALRIMRK
ncbi:hypothetical protein SAMN05421805_102244 [Saccharopolyspora antimicrobica]|uniref:Uncharacterized protein n=1 Tax=Saccharopolyspora antimicrobica TaxID=455193 RepID=A0A1I4VJL0_9PSEU|nr:hypothetical protein ATL45_4713 [Saccharopolyspora antimicrobica]SFN01464.1 hypothetical protein SAMN05421805_102244 [Saccharopolyspora antimicrobica]